MKGVKGKGKDVTRRPRSRPLWHHHLHDQLMNHQRQRQWRTKSVKSAFGERISDTAQTQTANSIPNGGHCSAVSTAERKGEKSCRQSVSQTKSIFVSRCSHTTISSSSLTKSQQERKRAGKVSFHCQGNSNSSSKQTNKHRPFSPSLGFVIAGKSLYSKSIISNRITRAEKHPLNTGPTKQCTLQIFN